MVLSAPAADALAAASVRFLDATPNAEPARLSLGGRAAGPPVGFGGVTPYSSVAAGRVSARLGDRSDPLAEAMLDLRDGERYTVIAFARDGRAELRAFRDAQGRAGIARLRTIHAAPELGSPDIRLGERTIAEKLAFRDGTRYLSLSPGRRSLAVVRPGGEGGPVVSRQVTLTAGTAGTAVIVGSGGEPERILVLEDDVLAPAAAPHTGLGGLSGDGSPRWLAILLAAMAGGALGGAAFAIRGRARAR